MRVLTRMKMRGCTQRSAEQCACDSRVCAPLPPVAHTVVAATCVRNPQKSSVCARLLKKSNRYKFMKHKHISTLEIALANILRDVLVLMSTLEIVLANIPRDVLELLDVADVHQCSKVDFPYCCF